MAILFFYFLLTALSQRLSSAKMRGYKIYLDGFYGKFSAIIVITVYTVQHFAKIKWDVDAKCTVWPNYSSFSDTITT